MLITFIKHEWLKFSRSPRLTTQIGQTILSGIFVVYFVILFLSVGYMLDRLVAKALPDKDVLTAVTSGVIYYMFFDFLMRYFFQNFRTVEIRSYITLPISKSKIALYLMTRSWFSVFNILPIFTLIPFVWSYGRLNYDSSELINFALIVLGLIVMNHLLVFLMNRSTGVSHKLLLGVGAGLVVSLFLDYYHVIPLFDFLYRISDWLLSSWVWSMIPIVIGLFLTIFLYRSLKALLMVETNDSATTSRLYDPSIRWFDQFGLIGQLMNLELKIMLRSKRARAYLTMSVFFFFYPLMLNIDQTEDVYILLAVGLVMTGMIALNQGQIMLSWNSAHFDLLLTRTIHIKDIFRAKYYLLVIFCVLSFFVTLPYYFYRAELIHASFVMLFYNATFSMLIYMLIASVNSKRIDIMSGSLMNYEGFSFIHFVIILPLIAIPCLIYWIGNTFLSEYWGGYGLLMSICLILLVLHDRIIDLCVVLFQKNRYKIAANFRIKKS